MCTSRTRYNSTPLITKSANKCVQCEDGVQDGVKHKRTLSPTKKIHDTEWRNLMSVLLKKKAKVSATKAQKNFF